MLLGTVDTIDSFDWCKNAIGKLIDTIEEELDVKID
jgi:hypothetical protein